MKKLLLFIIISAAISSCMNATQRRDEKIKRLLLKSSDSVSKAKNIHIDSLKILHVDSLTFKDFYTYFIHYHEHRIADKKAYGSSLAEGDSIETLLKTYVNDTPTIRMLKQEIATANREIAQHTKSIDSLKALSQNKSSAAFYGFLVRTLYYTSEDNRKNTYSPGFIISASDDIYIYNPDYFN